MTIVARTLVSVPERSAADTWERIVSLIAPDISSPARSELSAVAGVVCSCISDETLAHDALVVYGVGPRLRIYALYGDDALDGERANESELSWAPTNGDWNMSIPCLPDDLAWMQAKLAKSSTRVSARALGSVVEEDEEEVNRSMSTQGDAASVVDLDVFFRR
jgi:hypothetical protein